MEKIIHKKEIKRSVNSRQIRVRVYTKIIVIYIFVLFSRKKLSGKIELLNKTKSN